MSDSDTGSCSSDQGEGPVIEVVYPLNEETEVPSTDAQLFKTVLTEGRKENSHPPKGAKVTVHYVGTLEADGSKFDSSRDRSEPFEFTIGEGQVINGWDKGVATMNVGEVCILKCLPVYGYGAQGSPPTIPANSTLLFEVELISWTKSEDVSLNKDRSVVKSIVTAGAGYERPEYETKLKGSTLRVFLSSLGDGEEANATPDEDALQANHEGQGTGEILLDKQEWAAVLGDDPSYWFPGLEEAVRTMKRGEHCYVTVAPRRITAEHDALDSSKSGDMMPGAKDSEFYAKVLLPAAEAKKGLRFEVLLVDFETVKTFNYSATERVVEGLNRKADGNRYFMVKQWSKAELKYRRSLEFVDEELSFGDANVGENREENMAKARTCTVAVKSNLAQVMLNTDRYEDALQLCNSVLQTDGNHLKTLFRRAKAYGLLDEWQAAIEDLERLLDHDANNEPAVREIAHIKGKRAAFYKKEKAKYANMFSKISSDNE